MKKYKMFFLNIKYANLRLIIYYVLISIILAFYGVTFFEKNSEYISYSIGDIFLYLTGGINENKTFFNYINWFGFILIIYLPMVYVLSNQFQDKKIFIFYRVKKYKNWYYSNILWTIFNVLIFLLIIYISIFLISLCFKYLNPLLNSNEFNDLIKNTSLKSIIVKSFTLNFLFLNGLILLASNLTFLTRNFNASIISVILLSYLTSFGKSKFLIGNVAMIMKENIFKNGISTLTFKFSLLFLTIFFIANLILGHFLYRRNIEF